MAAPMFFYGTQEPMPDYLSLGTVEELNQAHGDVEDEIQIQQQNPLNIPNARILNQLFLLSNSLKKKRNALIVGIVYGNLRDQLGYMNPEEEAEVKDMIDSILIRKFPGTRIPQRDEIEYMIGPEVAKIIKENNEINQGSGLKIKRMLKYNIHSRRHY